MGTTTRIGQGIFSGAAALLLLTGCSFGDTPGAPPSGETTPPAVSSPGADPSASPEPESPASPVTELGLDCASLLDPGTASVANPTWAPRDYYDRESVEPADYAIAQEGGLVCTWNDGEAADAKNNAADGVRYSGLLVQVLPHAEAEWPQLVDLYGEQSAPTCQTLETATGTQASCQYDVLIGGTWVSFLANRLDVPDGSTPDKVVAPIVRAVTDAVAAADVTDEPWPLSGPIPAWSCVDGARLESDALGLGDQEARQMVPGGGYSVYAAAWQRAGASTCSTSVDGADGLLVPAVSESVLTGGAWALDQRLEFGLVDPSSAVDVPGLAEGDAAYRSCTTTCVTDLVIGDDWARLTVSPDALTDGDVEGASDRLAEAYVARALGS